MFKHVGCDHSVKRVVRVGYIRPRLHFKCQLAFMQSCQFVPRNVQRLCVLVSQDVLIESVTNKSEMRACPRTNLEDALELVVGSKRALQ